MNIPQLLAIAFIVLWIAAYHFAVNMQREEETTLFKRENFKPDFMTTACLSLAMVIAVILTVVMFVAIAFAFFYLLLTAAGHEALPLFKSFLGL